MERRVSPVAGQRLAAGRWRSAAAAVLWSCALWGHAQTPADTAGACECDGLVSRATAAETSGDFRTALTLLDSALAHARSGPGGGDDQVAQVLVRRGVVHQSLGDFNAAQSAFYQALTIRERLHDELGLAEVLNNIGSIHQYQQNFSKAREYYDRSLRIRERLDQPREVAKAWNNFGALFEDQGLPDSAMLYHQRSLAIWQRLGDAVWTGLSYMHIGNCFAKTGRPDSASHYLRLSADLLEVNNSRYLLGLVNVSLGDALRASGHMKEALDRCARGLREGEELATLTLQQRACECLYLTHSALGHTTQELTYYKRFIALRDSVFGQEKTKELMRIELGHTFAQQQLADSLVQAKQRIEARLAYERDIAREREKRNIFLFIVVGVVLIAAALWSRLRYMRRSRQAIQKERDRSETLLLNILPKGIAEELKEHGKAKARDIPDVTILFTDFSGFTELSARMSAQELVAEIDACFRVFDSIVDRYRIEKIKTIGDAYMAAGGLPKPSTDSASNVILAALDMQAYVIERRAERQARGLPCFSMRAGIHTGPVVAGIVGQNKFAYDIWGDTVNIASRMESSGEVDRVNISEATYSAVVGDRLSVVGLGDGSLTPGRSPGQADNRQRTTDHGQPTTDNRQPFHFTPRGLVSAKGKGELRMYFVSRC